MVLAAFVVILALGLVVTGGVVLSAKAGLHHEIDVLRAASANRVQQNTEAGQRLADDFRKADLPSKLAKVKDLTTAVKSLVHDNASVSQVQAALNGCHIAVFDYDAAAAPFPPGMLGALPPRIRNTDHTTDCFWLLDHDR